MRHIFIINPAAGKKDGRQRVYAMAEKLKREHDLDMGALREKHTPEALLGGLAYLVGVTKTPEPASARELAGLFSWENVRKENITITNP